MTTQKKRKSFQKPAESDEEEAEDFDINGKGNLILLDGQNLIIKYGENYNPGYNVVFPYLPSLIHCRFNHKT